MGLIAGLERMLGVSDIVAIERSLLDRHWDAIRLLIPDHRLGVWVPNEAADISHWLAKPIRQITTDRPDLATKLRGI